MIKRTYKRAHAHIRSKLVSTTHIKAAMPLVFIFAALVMVETYALLRVSDREVDEAYALSRLQSQQVISSLQKQKQNEQSNVPEGTLAFDTANGWPIYMDTHGEKKPTHVYSYALEGSGVDQEIIFRKYSFDISTPGEEILRKRIGTGESSGLVIGSGSRGVYLLPHACALGACVTVFQMSPNVSARDIILPGVQGIPEVRMIGSSLVGLARENGSMFLIRVDNQGATRLNLGTGDPVRFFATPEGSSVVTLVNTKLGKSFSVDINQSDMSLTPIQNFFPGGRMIGMETVDGENYVYTKDSSVFMWNPLTQVNREIIRNISHKGDPECRSKQVINAVHFNEEDELIIETIDGLFMYNLNSKKTSTLYRFNPTNTSRPQMFAFAPPYLFMSDGMFINSLTGSMMRRGDVSPRGNVYFFDAK
jgi:hypothetical protein